MRIFVIEDDPFYLKMLSYHITQNPDNEVRSFLTAKECLDFDGQIPDVITLDYSLPDMDGTMFLKFLNKKYPQTPKIVISSQQDVSTVLQLLHNGANDYIIKNDDTKERLWTILKNLSENLSLKNEIEELREEVRKSFDYSKSLIGESEGMKKVFSVMDKAISTKINVTISGETGTGKEVVAKSIHFNSPRAKKKFVAVNMSAIPDTLIESELFGYEKGAFTGAVNRRAGKFEEANGGTIFLDEIGELNINMQAKLLRVLQESEVIPLGGNQCIKLDVRIISATHKDLIEQVREGKFREDLYYRLIGLPIVLPPLRERGNDIILIANSLLNDFTERNKLPKKYFSTDAKKELLNYLYPGNIRELKSIVDLSAVMCEDKIIDSNDLSFNGIAKNSAMVFRERSLNDYTNEIIKHFLVKYENNVLKVASILQISKSKIYQMIKEGDL